MLSALDQNGRGNGDLIITTNGIPQNPRWTHQALEPCMSWNNIVTTDGHAIGFGGWFQDTEVTGRDYYNLGGGFPRDVIPAQAQAIYTSARNGGFIYDHEFTYPHPLVTGNPQPTPTPCPTASPPPSATPLSTPSPTTTETPTPTPSPTPTPTPTPSPHVAAIANATAVPGTYADTNTPAVVNADAYTNSYCDGDRDCHAKAYA